MLSLILILVIGSALAYLSQLNLMPVSVDFGLYVFSGVPLFYVMVGSLVLGLILSYLLNLIQQISTSFLIREKRNEIKKSRNEILELTKRVHQLELEKEKLKHQPTSEPDDANAL